jgi:acyl-CoA synthetase (AMP-forming)/AMP-acid ligase II
MDRFFGGVQMKVEAGMLSRHAAESFGGDAAVACNGRTLSFSELNEAACRFGSGLRAAGLQRGDRVGVLGYNCLELAEAWLGLEKHDLVRAVLHTHIGVPTHVFSMNHIEATALIFDTRQTPVIDAHREQFRTVRLFVAIGPDPPDWAVPFDHLVAEGSPEEPLLDVDEDAPCFLQLTSGTTGDPKPWVKTHRSWRAVIDHNLNHLDTFGDGVPPVGRWDVNLHFHPMQWASGFQTFYPYLLRGARTVLLDDESFDPELALETIVYEGVTGTLIPGPLLSTLLDAVAVRDGCPHRLRRMMVFFAAPELLQRTTELLGPVWAHGYGSSEQGAAVTRLLPADLDAHPERIGSVGRGGSPFVEIAVLDPVSEQPVGPGEIGEIAVRSAMSLGYYWGEQESTRAAFFARDWFRPRDVGHLDEDGFLYYADRAGDEITLAGTVVYPHHLEAQISCHPEVSNCGVVGLSEGDALEVVAAVQLKGSACASTELESELLTRCSSAGHRPPDRVVFVDELPTVLGGSKVRRASLREQLRARVNA